MNNDNLNEDALIADIDMQRIIANNTDAAGAVDADGWKLQRDAYKAAASMPSARSACAYERKRGTEQECSRELWRARTVAMVKGLATADPYGAPFIACTVHLPKLMTDRFVAEYQLARIER